VLAPAGSAHWPDDAAGAVATPSSPLAAEVARIDAARTSNAVGDYDGTVQLVERYHRDFPSGALAPDADVVALEAVAAKRDRAETARRAALFLSRYPGDPHAARVKWLAGNVDR
jgi:TolA-binding protein